MGRPNGDIPGQVLKAITEEHRHLGQFVDLLKRRIELDRKYLDDLEQLHQSFINPIWSQSAIWPLVEPFVDYFSREVASRRGICELLDNCIQELPDMDSFDLSDDNGTLMTEEYEKLGDIFQEHTLCRTEASSLPSIAELKVWHGRQYNEGPLHDLTKSELDSFSLPSATESTLVINYDSYRKSGRAYRQCVTTAAKIHQGIRVARYCST
ncbi:hypothetical protein CPB86DRAFT_80351 [Serendipita vermifera]|nr:hypothetical protein CPB86DRAFT_80351 [Serendipita vermifera]